MVQAAKKIAHETLTRLSKLPRAVESDWLEHLEKEG
jgi:hypothetical protein